MVDAVAIQGEPKTIVIRSGSQAYPNILACVHLRTSSQNGSI